MGCEVLVTGKWALWFQVCHEPNQGSERWIRVHQTKELVSVCPGSYVSSSIQVDEAWYIHSTGVPLSYILSSS